MSLIKRISLLLLCLLLLLACACGTTDSKAPSAIGHLDPKKPVTVALWHYYVGENQQALEAAVSTFNQSLGIEHGVIVEPIAMGSISELEESITNAAKGIINARAMPQIFSSYADKAQEIDELGQVVDLNAYFTDAEKDLYVQDFLADGMFSEGRLLMVPIVKSTELLYVNDTDWRSFSEATGWDAASLETWESLLDTARAYYRWTASGEDAWDGTALMGFDSLANYIIIGSRQLGLDIIDGEKQEAVLDEAVLRRVFDLYYKGYALGYFDAVGKFRSDDIKAGKLIAYVGSSSSAAYFPTWIEQDNTESPIDFLAQFYPTFEGGVPTAIQQGAGMCIAKSTPAQQEGAALFLKWFTDSAQNIPFAMTTGYLPVQTEAYASEAFTEALQTLRTGDEARRNVAAVYEVALEQTSVRNTYAASPFPGSYTVRTTLQATLADIAEAGRNATIPLKAQGLSEEEILAALDTDAQFAAWLASVESALQAAEITTRRQGE